jgi:hypothetical protein
MNHSRFFAILGFILIGALSRFLPHPPNFTAINTIALFGACYLGSLSLTFFTVFSVMLFSDLILGFHSSMLFVYLSFGSVILMGHWLKNSKIQIPLLLLLSSLLFFVVSNFGEWFSGTLYPKTIAGLELCYLAAIPFIANQVLGDLFYGLILFGSFSLAEKFIPSINTQFNEST